MQVDKLKSLIGSMNGWFIVIISIICAFAIFMSVSNAVAYGTLISKDSPDIFGKLLIQKMQLVKLINSEGSHLAHVAKVN
jgi:hypothetical protein